LVKIYQRKEIMFKFYIPSERELVNRLDKWPDEMSKSFSYGRIAFGHYPDASPRHNKEFMETLSTNLIENCKRRNAYLSGWYFSEKYGENLSLDKKVA